MEDEISILIWFYAQQKQVCILGFRTDSYEHYNLDISRFSRWIFLVRLLINNGLSRNCYFNKTMFVVFQSTSEDAITRDGLNTELHSCIFPRTLMSICALICSLPLLTCRTTGWKHSNGEISTHPIECKS